ncbi:hypothetical protein P7K49_038686 [Saguinus oedipus]|uniref:Uncharacterized protein n=1 Tax=Saguinus oedipus TaxID=9490 RepID=A0ABQ9TFF2_SAGOE|nr:hypothetical protein P7K49_038686 [Saguinus oedipus]
MRSCEMLRRFRIQNGFKLPERNLSRKDLFRSPSNSPLSCNILEKWDLALINALQGYLKRIRTKAAVVLLQFDLHLHDVSLGQKRTKSSPRRISSRIPITVIDGNGKSSSSPGLIAGKQPKWYRCSF